MRKTRKRTYVPLGDIVTNIGDITEQLSEAHRDYGYHFYGNEGEPEWPPLADLVDSMHALRNLLGVMWPFVQQMGHHLTHFKEFDPETVTEHETEQLIRGDMHMEYAWEQMKAVMRSVEQAYWQMRVIQRQRLRASEVTAEDGD